MRSTKNTGRPRKSGAAWGEVEPEVEETAQNESIADTLGEVDERERREIEAHR